MSKKKDSPSRRALRLSLVTPKVCAEMLGKQIRSLRNREGRTVEEIAPLVGMTVAEWEAMEAGRPPDSWELLRLITVVLFLDRSWLPYLEEIWAGARRDDLRREKPWLFNP